MQLDVADGHILPSGDRQQGLYLPAHLRVQLLGRQQQAAAAEALAIGEAGVRAHRDAVRLRRPECRSHARFITRVTAAGDRGGRYDTEKGVIAADALAEIGVEVEERH
jgi:hypothetical protein